jgi:hypothetical protein
MEMAVQRFAHRVFLFSGIYGLIVLVPQLFTESRIARDFPPAITHPEYFYGFLGVAIAWQLCFLVIARDPVRYRMLMLPAIVEKLAFSVPSIVFFVQHRLSAVTTSFASFDLVLGALFLAAYRLTRPDRLDRASV